MNHAKSDVSSHLKRVPMLECVRTRQMTSENVRKGQKRFEAIAKRQWKTLENIGKGWKGSENMANSVLMLEKSRLKVRNHCHLIAKKSLIIHA